MFDTLRYAKRLEASGITREQSETQIAVMTEMIMDGVATKQDLSLTRQELKQDLADLRQELKQDIVDLKQELKQDIVAVKQDIMDLRYETQKEFGQLENKLTIKLGAMLVACMSLMLAYLSLAH